MMNVTDVARVCHEANRAYCLSLGDASQPDWNHAPEWQRLSAIEGVRFHLRALRNGETPEPSASHDSWLMQKQQEGWSYGTVKDAEKKTHPCYVPFEQLPIEQRMKDYIFGAIVKGCFDGAGAQVQE